MKLLLDTHILVWVTSRSSSLPFAARTLLTDPTTQPIFSVASLWEIAIKTGRGRPDFQVDVRQLRHELLANGYHELTISGSHASAVSDLPQVHKDPFDRLLIAQSIVEGITLLTADPVLAMYPCQIRRV